MTSTPILIRHAQFVVKEVDIPAVLGRVHDAWCLEGRLWQCIETEKDGIVRCRVSFESVRSKWGSMGLDGKATILRFDPSAQLLPIKAVSVTSTWSQLSDIPTKIRAERFITIAWFTSYMNFIQCSHDVEFHQLFSTLEYFTNRKFCTTRWTRTFFASEGNA